MKTLPTSKLILACAVFAFVISAKADRYVAQLGQKPQSPYQTWDTAASNIQTCVNAALANETVWVSNGIYRSTADEVIKVGSRAVTIRGLSDDPADVIIDGEGVRRCLYALFGSAGSNTIFRAVTLMNGFNSSSGGGIHLYFNPDRTIPAKVSFQKCVFTHNEVQSTGAGINASGGYPMDGDHLHIEDTLFTHNQAGSNGGAVYSPVGILLSMDNCQVLHNSAPSYAGGVYAINSNSVIRGTTFLGNEAKWGGGMHFINGLLVENCRFISNEAEQGGGAYSSGGTHMSTFRNCLFVDNYASSTSYGSGIQLSGGNGRIFENCTFAANRGYAVSCRNQPIIFVNTIVSNTLRITSGDIYATNCLTATSSSYLTGSEGYIIADPKFVNAEEGDFRLDSGSPAVDSAIYLPWMASVRDLDGNVRVDIRSNKPDRGCYERYVPGMLILLY